MTTLEILKRRSEIEGVWFPKEGEISCESGKDFNYFDYRTVEPMLKEGNLVIHPITIIGGTYSYVCPVCSRIHMVDISHVPKKGGMRLTDCAGSARNRYSFVTMVDKIIKIKKEKFMFKRG